MNTGSARKPAHARVVVVTTVAVVLIAGAVTLLLALGQRETPTESEFPRAKAARTSTPQTPMAISRADLMNRYAQIAPYDQSATPEAIDRLASMACQSLGKGQSTDALITTLTSTYQSNATQVAQLLVSYECPAYLSHFK